MVHGVELFGEIAAVDGSEPGATYRRDSNQLTRLGV